MHWNASSSGDFHLESFLFDCTHTIVRKCLKMSIYSSVQNACRTKLHTKMKWKLKWKISFCKLVADLLNPSYEWECKSNERMPNIFCQFLRMFILQGFCMELCTGPNGRTMSLWDICVQHKLHTEIYYMFAGWKVVHYIASNCMNFRIP